MLVAVATVNAFVMPHASRRAEVSLVPAIGSNSLLACQRQPDLLKSQTFAVGERVEGLFGASRLGGSFGCRWFPGEVTAARPDGTFDLRYDDGEAEERVLAKYMRVPGAAPLEEDEDWEEPPWLVRLRERAAASSEKRVAALRQLAESLRPLEASLSTLGLGVRLVDKKTGLPITPDAFVFLGLLTALQVWILGLLLSPFRG